MGKNKIRINEQLQNQSEEVTLLFLGLASVAKGPWCCSIWAGGALPYCLSWPNHPNLLPPKSFLRKSRLAEPFQNICHNDSDMNHPVGQERLMWGSYFMPCSWKLS